MISALLGDRVIPCCLYSITSTASTDCHRPSADGFHLQSRDCYFYRETSFRWYDTHMNLYVKHPHMLLYSLVRDNQLISTTLIPINTQLTGDIKRIAAPGRRGRTRRRKFRGDGLVEGNSTAIANFFSPLSCLKCHVAFEITRHRLSAW